MKSLQVRLRGHYSAFMTQIWSNGCWLDGFDFQVAPTDRGAMHGLGLFETILAVDGRPVFAKRHMDRLHQSCERLGWRLELPQMDAVMAELIERNHLSHGRCRVRVAITGGSGPVHDLSLGEDFLVWMSAFPVPEAPLHGAVNVSPWVRNERSPLAGLKCASYAENIVAMDHARRLGFCETLFFNSAGHLCEAATSNVFLVKHGAVLTPSLASGCLQGITRCVVMERAVELGIPCKEADLSVEDLESADEVFLTSSIRGLMGVSRLVDRELEPGTITRILHDAWETATKK